MNININEGVRPFDVMQEEGSRLHSCLFSQIQSPNLIMRKSWDKSKLRDILQNTWSVLIKSAKVMKNKERLKYFHRFKVTET